jgi:hypothetical protein
MATNPLTSLFARLHRAPCVEAPQQITPSRSASNIRRKPNTVLGVIRISDPDQSKYSLKMQRNAITSWARANNLIITDWLVLKKSATKIIEELIQKTRENNVAFLACWRIDRVLRTGEYGLRRLISGIGPTILISTSEGCNSRQHLEKIEVLCQYGTEEARSISKRTKLAMTLIKVDVGRAPLGWKYRRGMLIKDKRMQTVISRIKKLSRKGMSCQKISDRLNARLKHKIWTAQRVWSVLNPPGSR